jgi:uncharacterized membrane protein YfcA
MEEYVRVATSLPPAGQLHTLIGIAFVLGLGKGGVPGLATVATAATVLTAPSDVPGGLSFAVSLMVPVLTAVDVHAASLHRNHLDWHAVLLLLPISFVGMTIGCAIDGRVSDSNARLLVGIVLLGILTLQARGLPPMTTRELMRNKKSTGDDYDDERRRTATTITVGEGGDPSRRVNHDGIDDHRGGRGCSRRNHRSRDVEDGDCDPIPSNAAHPSIGRARRKKGTARIMIMNGRYCPNYDSRLLWVCIVGLVGGSSTMLTNSMGPMVNVYLLSVEGLSPRSYVGTRAAFFCVVNLMKIPMRIYGGTLGMSMAPLACFLSLVAAVGVGMAKPIMLNMNERTFVILELGVVAFAGLRLCYLGLVG